MNRLPLALPLLLAFGCTHPAQVRKDAIPSSPATTTAARSAALGPSPPATGCASDVDCGSRQLCIRSRCVDITPDLTECRMTRVPFDFNQVIVRDESRSDLQRVARCLRADQAMHIIIEGNADERGTEEYNLALGDQRATAVERYLEALGASKEQLQTVSYGKEHPLCTEHNEGCWAKNRRAAVRPAFAR